MTSHLLRMTGMTALMVLCAVYPFFPGGHDPLAVPLSIAAQLCGATGLLLVPIGILWLVTDLRWGSTPSAGRRRRFQVAALIVAALGALAVSLLLSAAVGFAAGSIALALSSWVVARCVARLTRSSHPHAGSVDLTPFYLVLVPVTTVVLLSWLAAPVTKYSRNRAIANSEELITALERHRRVHGRYPSSLHAVWPDYSPSVVGVERFHYAPNADAYDLVFEQPTLLFDNIGTREFVVYNKSDQHVMPSHAAWILTYSRDGLAGRQGWYAVHDASSPHWKYFWFD